MLNVSLAPASAARLLLLAARQVGTLRWAGDVPGHEFHGNQWTDRGSSKISAEQVDALQDYTAGGELNMILRGSGTLSPYDIKNNTVGKLDASIAAQPVIPEKTTLWRIVDSEVGADLEKQGSFKDKGFVSTTKSVKGIEDIAGDIGVLPEEMTIVRITVEKGVRGLDVNAHLPNDRNYFHYQREVLLERGLAFKVTGTAAYGKWRVLNVSVG